MGIFTIYDAFITLFNRTRATMELSFNVMTECALVEEGET